MKKTREPIDILTKQDFLSTFYENISRIMVLVTIVGIVPIFLIGSIFYIKAGDLVFGIIEIVFAVILLIISTINIIPKDAKKTWLLLILYFFAVFTLITTGIKGAGASSILIVILFASIINRFSKRYLLFFINLITLSIITILLYLNVFGELEIANYKETWPFIFMVINLYAYGFIFVVGNYIRGLNDLSILSENQNAFLHSLINGIDEAIITINAAGHIVLMNNFAQELLGVNRQMNGENYQNFIREITQEMHKNNGETPILDGSLEDGTFVFVKNFSVQMKYLEKHVYTITNYDLHETHHIIILNDVTYKKIQEEELKQLSFHDFLTGLYNRRFYETELVRLNTKRFLPISLILCDINGLKLVNDSFGHQVGDEVLKGFASCLQKIGRSSDIIARIGGDEFIMLLPHTTANAAEKIIERLKQMTDECTVNNFELSYSIEYGTKSVEEININSSVSNHYFS